MLFDKKDKLENIYLFYIILCIVVYIIGSITVPLMEIDSVQYANISREMLLNKSFLQIFDQGKDYLDKPPMLFWFSALSMYIFGINDIAFRIPSILMAVLAIYSTYRFAMLYYVKEIALLAALALASSQAMFLITHDLRTDTMLMAWVILGIWQFSSWLFTKKWISLITAFVAVAFGMMTKGPIALMVPIFSFVPHFLIHKNFKLLFKWEYLVGVVIILVLLIPMDIGLYQQFDLHPEKVMYEKTGTSGLRFFYWTQSFGRITGESVWHENGYFFFLFENLIWGFLPWILFFIIGLVQEFYTILKNKFRIQSHEEWISIPGFLITYTALGISNYQLPHYIYVVLPFVSIIAAKSIYSLITVNENKILRNSISVMNGILFSLVIIILVVLLVIPFSLNYYLISITVLIFIIIFGYSIYKQKQLIPKTIHFALFAILVTNLLLNVFFYPKLLEYQLGNSVTKYINVKKIDKKNFYLYKIYGERSLDFYSNYSFKIIEDANALKTADYLLLSNKLITKDLLTKFDTIEAIAAFHVSTLNANFLNPKTRDSALDYYYILQKK